MNMLISQYRFYTTLLLCSVCVLWAACDTGQQSVQPPGYFEINVAGDLTESFAGRDVFYATYTEPESGVNALLIQFASDDGVSRGMALTGPSDDVPAEGLYEVIEFDEDIHNTLEPLGEAELLAEYTSLSPSGEQNRIHYTSVSGELEVTLSADNRLEGTFEFTAKLDSEEQMDDPPEIVVSGVFEANRSEIRLQ